MTMKTTKLMSMGLISMTVLALGVSTAQAADPITATTTGDVTFNAPEPTEPVDPTQPEVVDPTDPTKPGGPVDPGTDPEEGSGGNGTAAFNINWVSNFKFNDITIGSTEMKSYAKPTTLHFLTEPGGTLDHSVENLANFLQVTDNRGTNSGWNVSVSGTPFYELAEGGVPTATELKGAQIFLESAQIVGVDDNKDLAPTFGSIGTDLLATNEKNEQITSTVFSAAANKGQGTWSVTWGAGANGTEYVKGQGVKLVVPVTAMPKADTTYQSTLTWTLADAPAS